MTPDRHAGGAGASRLTGLGGRTTLAWPVATRQTAGQLTASRPDARPDTTSHGRRNPALRPVRRRHRRHQRHRRRGDRGRARAQGARCWPARNGILGVLREELIDTSKESPAAIRGLAPHARAARSAPAASSSSRWRRTARVRAPARRVPRPRRALVPLQRRQRFGRHRAEGLAAGAANSAIR